MALTLPTLDELIAETAAAYRARFPTKAHDRDSYFGKKTRALALSLLGFMKKARDVSIDMVPNFSMSDLAADAWAYAIGVVSNDPAVVWGRNSATPATGGAGVILGVIGTVVPDGTLLADPTAQVTLRTSGAVTMAGALGVGQATATIVAVTKGPSGNLLSGTVLTFVTTPANILPQVTLTQGLSGGKAKESTVELVARLFRQLRDPKRGGSAADFRRWCETYLDSNGVQPGYVKRSYGYPLRGGAGTFHSVITGSGTGLRRLLGAGVQAAVQAFVNLVRPATSQHRTLLPSMGASAGCALQVRVTPSAPRYEYDWYDGAAGAPLISYAGGKVKINFNVATSAAYATLKAAIDAGRNPRLQIIAAASPMPVVVRCNAYTNAAQSELTLIDTPTVEIDGAVEPVVLAPLDMLYAGGPVVTPVAKRLMALANGLGPSRQSGYADPNDPWDDTLRIGAMIDAAMETVDPTDGKTRMVKDVLPTATTINGFNVNKTARDIVVGGSPELLYATSIVVQGPT